MIGWAELRAAAQAGLPPADIARVATSLAGRRWKLGDVGRRMKWPAAAEIEAALTVARDALNDDDFARLLDVLRQPVRRYVLRAAPGEERYALLGSWEGPELGWAEVCVASGQLELRYRHLPPDAPGLADELNELYCEVDPQHRPASDPLRRSLDCALWVGGSAGEAADADWEHRISALFASRGLDVAILTRPGDTTLDHALRAVEGFRGVLTLIWGPCAGDRARRARMEDASKSPEVVDEEDFDLALVEAALVLDKRDQDRALELDGVGAPDQDPSKPLTGGPHYFKKTGTGRGNYGDRMQKMTGPCTHNNFRRARRPDQAKRGIARVARVDPVKLEHCESCTGGGFWRAWF